MITEDKITEIFCMADDFCKFFDAMIAKYTLKPIGKRKYHRSSTMLKTEVMLIIILFYDSGYRCFKHFYLEKVCKHLRHLFPNVVSYNSLVKLERDVANIAQVEHSRHRCFAHFIVNLLGAIAPIACFKETVRQCTKEYLHTAWVVFNSSNLRYFGLT